ncbi:hypothetical protein [Longirhabdus pacifica]|uniref:hypothetical protein n=1 Tax=Longirhabdus pacifica TaxID=2305227 RepID=UPI0010087754|nr:hypothetical protein [Longirhabdus pacifica]
MPANRLEHHQPIIKGYLFYAFPLSIIGYNEQTSPWILSNFIQTNLEMDYANSPIPYTLFSFDFKQSPWLKMEKITRKTLHHVQKDMLSTLKYFIDEQKYIYLYLDEYYIPRRRTYHQSHFLHENLIFGYDDDAQTFDVLGYDEKMIFKPIQISYEALMQSYNSVEDIMHASMDQNTYSDSFDVFSTITLFERNPHASYAFNYKLVRESLTEYLNGSNSFERFASIKQPPSHCVYGMDCYSYIEKYFRSFLAGEVPYDIRFLHILYEHKLLMTKRIQYIHDHKWNGAHGNLLVQCQEIEDLALAMRNLFVRYSLHNHSKYVTSILDKLQQTAEMEKDFLEQCLTEAF